jgi:hypothetical protein
MKEYSINTNKRVAIYDDVFDLSYREFIYEAATKAKFSIGWTDSDSIERQTFKYLYSEFNQADLDYLKLPKKIANSPIQQEIEGYTISKVVLNLTTPTDTHFIHTHPEDKVVLYYVNLHWDNSYYGETLFFSESCQEIMLATPYTPGRITVFDASIPHTIRPQSATAPHYRFTLAMVFNKC